MYTHTYICLKCFFFPTSHYAIPYKTVSQSGKGKFISCPLLQGETYPEVYKYRKVLTLHSGSTVLTTVLFSTVFVIFRHFPAYSLGVKLQPSPISTYSVGNQVDWDLCSFSASP